MRNAAIKYYKKHEGKLPLDNEESVVTTNTLIAEKYMKELSKYVGKDTSCSGNVTVLNNDGKYAYIPYLDCGKKYKTKLLVDSILENNEVVETGDGLYVDEKGNYNFRGEYINNYLIFGNLKYRILRINADGSIRLLLASPIKDYKSSVWDDRYNVDKSSSVGINTFDVSRIKDFLATIYNDKKIFQDEQKALIVKQDLCLGSRSQKSEDLTDAQECSKVLENQNLGLLQLNEYLYPSTDDNCVNAESRSCLNYNYMAKIQNSFWTQTPYEADTYQVYRISNAIYLAKAKSNANVLFTLHLSGKAQISEGDGTASSPYVVKDYTKNTGLELKNT